MPDGAVPERFEERRDWLLGFVTAGDRVLDLDANLRRSARAAVAAGARVTMADVAEAALERARVKASGAEAVRLEEDAPLPFTHGSFDLVWCGETLEHVADASGLAREVRRVLRADGTLLVTVPNQPRLWVAFESLAGRPLEERLDPRSDHLRFFTARTLEALLAGAGFGSIQVGAAGGLPGYRQSLRAVAR